MKIVILSRNPNLYSTSRLYETCIERGHETRIIDFLRCYMIIEKENPVIYYEGEKITNIDAIIPRIGSSKTFYGTAVVRQFEMMNTFCLNSSQAIVRSRDKLRSMQILSKSGLGMPVTAMASNTTDINHIINDLGGAPVIVKLLQGTQGIGVVLAETKKAAKSVLEAFYGLKANMLIQEYIKEAKGADIRALVIGNRVVAAIKRQGADGEFRSNIHRGGTAHKIGLNKEEKQTAIKAAKLLGLNVAGVDMLQSEKGPLLMEVNSTPGLQGIESSTSVDVASEIIKFIEKNENKRPKTNKSLTL